MAGTFARTDPTPVIVRQMVAEGTGGATGARLHGVVTVSVPVPQNIVTSDGTGNGGFLSWINPEKGTILVTDVVLYKTVAGTGTFDLGISADGTGTNAAIFDGASLSGTAPLAERAYGTAATHGTLASTAGFSTVFVLGPGGTGTNNSLVSRTTEPASTAVGYVVINYVALPG